MVRLTIQFCSDGVEFDFDAGDFITRQDAQNVAETIEARVTARVPMSEKPRDTQASVAELMALIAVRRAEREAGERARAAEHTESWARLDAARAQRNEQLAKRRPSAGCPSQNRLRTATFSG